MGLVYALLAAVVLVSVAYWLAGDVWRRRHSLHYRLGGRARRCSGAFGEIALIGFGALLLFIVDRTSEATRLSDIPRDYPLASLLGLLAVVAVAYWHGLGEARRAEPHERSILTRTYLVYGGFTTIFFYGGLLLLGLLVLETRADVLDFTARRDGVLADVAALSGASPSDQARGLEAVLLDSEGLLASMQDSLAPIFVFVAGIFTVNLAIRLTPLRSLFVDNAMLITHLSTLVGVLILVLAAGFVYVGPYSEFIDALLASLEGVKASIFETDAATVRRYSDIVLRVHDQKSVVGFLSRISSEWGGLAAALGAAQWIAEQFAKPEAQAPEAAVGAAPKPPIPAM